MRPLRWMCLFAVTLLVPPVPLRAALPSARSLPGASREPPTADWRDAAVRAYVRDRTTRALAAHLPSFARQTGLACSACHYQFLTLTPLGRQFKLNGYTLTRQQFITEKDRSKGKTLELLPAIPLAAMLQASLSHTTDARPGVQNDNAELPQQLSVFLAGALSSRLGLFSQLTYSGADGGIGIDNIDLRYASPTTLGHSTDLVYGFDLNNNPTVQDPWNTVPAWGFPFAASDVAPSGAAGTVVDGALAQQVLGLGAYTFVAGTVYAEFSVYRSAQQGRAAADSFALHGVAPYWRFALQHDWERQSLMVGTYGLRANLFPGAVGAGIPTDHFTDIGLDAQAETGVGSGSLVLRGTWIHEKQTLDATFADGGSANPDNVLRTLRVNTSYYPFQRLGVTLGYFQTTGTTDTLRYAPAPVTGSASGDPKTNGFIGELDFNPWQNARLAAQYTLYDRFNGGKDGYDGFGRRATGNNTLYLLAWVAF
ncbi:MAG TPA: hypothetical protein VFS40_01610 [Gemmatimonadales bacterium]|nr:hypothetical protein [Gemmatimonadales bacterium]